VRDGILADVAPTLLEMLGVPKPKQMTGKSLLVHKHSKPKTIAADKTPTKKKSVVKKNKGRNQK
jgi:arylsulfatase A-like enzyme